jgi:hypothetical protein
MKKLAANEGKRLIREGAFQSGKRYDYQFSPEEDKVLFKSASGL